jgi:predicted nucleic acid-binding protein
MAELVVDASVVVKWYIPEQDHEPARALRDDYLERHHDLVAPSLLPFEVVNALEYSGEYDDDRLLEASESLPEYGIELVPYHNVGRVAELANELEITIYNASYLALAQEAGTTAYTADGRLLDELEGEYAELAEHIRTY